ncbi:unnamed protein product, partial [Polarella glacialis]
DGLGAECTSEVVAGMATLIDYVGGAMVYARGISPDRIELLISSWKEAHEQNMNMAGAPQTDGSPTSPKNDVSSGSYEDLLSLKQHDASGSSGRSGEQLLTMNNMSGESPGGPPGSLKSFGKNMQASFGAVILIYARRMKRQAGQNDTGPAAVGSPSSSVMTTANFVAPHLVNAADVGYFLLKTCLGVLPFHLQADQPMWNAFKNRNDEAKLQGRTPFLYIELTSLRCATDNTRFSRSVSQWTSTFLRYATVAVGFGHLSWPQIISHVDVIMQPAEAELTKGRPAYAAFVYDDLVRKQFALRAEKKDPNLDIGNQIQTVNKELFEQVRQQLESVLTAAGMNNNSSGSGSQVKVADAAGAAMLKGQGKGENGKSGKEGKKGQTQNWQQNDGGFQKTKKMLKKEAWFNKNKNLADERKSGKNNATSSKS